MDSFFLMEARPLVQDSPTMKLHELLDWVEISHKLKGLYKREATNGGGPEPYSELALWDVQRSLKALVDPVFAAVSVTKGS